MITVQYQARLGNQLFQYCFGRILAEALGYRLSAPPIPPFSETESVVDGEAFTSPVWECPELADLSTILADRTPRHIQVTGYMQRYAYYRPYRQKIRQWLALPRAEQPPEPDSLVVHIRLGDYRRLGWVLSPGYYHHAIAQERFRRLYIVTDEPDSPYLESFATYQPTVVTGSPIGSLRFIRSASRIVLSQSTYSWWGAYLSEAEKIYYPVPRRSLWGPRSPVDLRVDDPRYIYVTGVNTLKKETS